MTETGKGLRVDKWLWHARFFKSRSLAAKVVEAGHLRINQTKISKPSREIKQGDVLTFPQAKVVRVVRVTSLSTRRGPAPEARALYDDLSPPAPRAETAVLQNPRYEGKGRPTKKDRRNLRLSDASRLE